MKKSKRKQLKKIADQKDMIQEKKMYPNDRERKEAVERYYLEHDLFETPLRELKRKIEDHKAQNQWIHLSPNPISAFYNVAQHNDSHLKHAYKPNGLFISRGSKWLDWCLDSQYQPHEYKHVYRVEPAPLSKILHLNNRSSLQHFVQTYSTKQLHHGNDDSMFFSTRFDWEEVAQKYDGIHLDQNVVDDYLDVMNGEFVGAYDVETIVLWHGKHVLVELV